MLLITYLPLKCPGKSDRNEMLEKASNNYSIELDIECIGLFRLPLARACIIIFVDVLIVLVSLTNTSYIHIVPF